MFVLGIVLLGILFVTLSAIVLDSQVGRAIAARLEQNPKGIDVSQVSRLNALESEVERLSREVGRLEEETVFLHKLLEDRPRELPPGDSNA